VEEQAIHNAVCLGLISGGDYVDSAVVPTPRSVMPSLLKALRNMKVTRVQELREVYSNLQSANL
jgi:hypothetical protein